MKTMWIQVVVEETPSSHAFGTSRMYELRPVSRELQGTLAFSTKPEFLNAAMMRIGVPNRPSPGYYPSGSATPPPPQPAPVARRYDLVEEGSIEADVENLVEGLTGRKKDPLASLAGNLFDMILKPRDIPRGPK